MGGSISAPHWGLVAAGPYPDTGPSLQWSGRTYAATVIGRALNLHTALRDLFRARHHSVAFWGWSLGLDQGRNPTSTLARGPMSRRAGLASPRFCSFTLAVSATHAFIVAAYTHSNSCPTGRSQTPARGCVLRVFCLCVSRARLFLVCHSLIVGARSSAPAPEYLAFILPRWRSSHTGI